MSPDAFVNKPARNAERAFKRKRREVLKSEAIVAVAIELLEQQGFERTTVDEIAAAAGLAKRTIFRHFSSKPDIVLHPIRSAFRTLPDILAAAPKSLVLEQAMRLGLNPCCGHGPRQNHCGSTHARHREFA